MIDQLSQNPRMLVDGLAGTGKTLLAIESARRAVESGRRVLLLCYNRLLAAWLAEQTAPLGEACVTRTLHQHMREVAGTGGPAAPSDERGSEASAYFGRDLPLAALEVLTRDQLAFGLVFDELIVDEAQDIIGNDNYLDVIDASLAQGLAGGRWRLFGDFSRQAIFCALDDEPRHAFERRLGFAPPLVLLRENCRNTPRVAHLADGVAVGSSADAASGATSTARVDSRYRVVRRDDDGHDPIVCFYGDGADSQRDALVAVLDQLLEEGFRAGDIVVLSRHSYANCAACGIDTQPWRDRLQPFESATDGHTRYCSIYKFKGLEAPAVVITDIDPPEAWPDWSSDDDVRSLVYVGATRALSRVALLAHEHWRGVLPLEPLDAMGVEPARVGEEIEAHILPSGPVDAASATSAAEPPGVSAAIAASAEPVSTVSAAEPSGPTRSPWFVLKLGRFKIEL